MAYQEMNIEGRNAVIEAFRSGKTVDKLYLLDGCQDGPVRTIVRESKKHDVILKFVSTSISYSRPLNVILNFIIS